METLGDGARTSVDTSLQLFDLLDEKPVLL